MSPASAPVPGGVLGRLREPIVQAPMAGGPSTPELAAAVCNAGGLGFLAMATKPAQRAQSDLATLRGLTAEPFGVNLFVPSPPAVDERALESYAAHLAPQAERVGVTLGASRPDDDDWAAKLELICDERPAVVSFTFGCPSRELVDRLHGSGSEVWVTVTEPDEAREAAGNGADALVVQGSRPEATVAPSPTRTDGARSG